MRDVTPGLRVHVLGRFEVVVEGRAVPESDWRLRKAKNLVKLLALAPGHRLHRDQLLDLLWPDQEPEAAANNLHKAVHVARRALESDRSAATPSRYLRVQADWLVLGGECPLWVDAEMFELAADRARTTGEPAAYEWALELYKCDLLPEDLYEDWAVGRREMLRAEYLSLLLELAELRISHGLPHLAVEPLQRLVVIEPSNEEARATLMRVYAQLGQRHQALRQYQQLRAALRRELNVEPSPATELLYREILAGRLTSDARQAPTSAGLPSRPAPAREPALPTARDDDRDALEEAVDTLFHGRGELVDLADKTTAAKGRLAQEILERLRSKSRPALFGATSAPNEESLPQAAAIDLRGRGGMLARLSDGQMASGQAVTHPVMGPGDRAPQVISGCPVLVVLDDLSAADGASLELLSYVAKATRDSTVLVLAALNVEKAS